MGLSESAALLVQEGWRAPTSRVVITSLILLLPPRRLSLCFALSGSRFTAPPLLKKGGELDHAQFRQHNLCAQPLSLEWSRTCGASFVRLRWQGILLHEEDL